MGQDVRRFFMRFRFLSDLGRYCSNSNEISNRIPPTASTRNRGKECVVSGQTAGLCRREHVMGRGIFLRRFRWRMPTKKVLDEEKGLTQTVMHRDAKEKYEVPFYVRTYFIVPIFGIRHPTSRSPLFFPASACFFHSFCFSINLNLVTMRVLAVLALIGSAAAFAPAPS